MITEIDERAVFIRGPVVVFKWRNAIGWPVEYSSPNAAEVFGYTAEEFMRGEVSYSALIDPQDAPRVGEEVRVASAGAVASFVHEPYRVRHRDGSVRWLLDVTQVLRGPDGLAVHYLGYVVDITARVAADESKLALERRLLHAQKLESLGVLAGGVAHDFNNLLTGILGQASLARLMLGPTHGDLREGVEQIERLALRAADLTRQLLAYSGRGRFVVLDLDLGAIVRDMVGMLKTVISKKATLHILLAPDLPSVMADRSQIQQVVMNLITNASEALGDDTGVITIRTDAREQSAAHLAEAFGGWDLPGGTYVSLEVSDTGCGMSQEVIERLFDPFFTTKFTGRGLGMSAVLGIVRGHKGAIRVYSEPNKGTVFRLAFPASNRPAAPPDTPRPAPARRGHGVVLVVDDEVEVRSTAADMLELLGFEVITAKDGAEAVALYGGHAAEIVLVLLDMTMPVMGGEETLRALRRLAPRLPVLMSSGFNEQEAIRRLEGQSVAAFLQKPYCVEDLADAVHAALAKGMPR